MAATLWAFFSVLLLLLSRDAQSSDVSGSTSDRSGGSGSRVRDRFKIEGRAVVPGWAPGLDLGGPSAGRRRRARRLSEVSILRAARKQLGWKLKGILPGGARCQNRTSLSEGERASTVSGLCRNYLVRQSDVSASRSCTTEMRMAGARPRARAAESVIFNSF